MNIKGILRSTAAKFIAFAGIVGCFAGALSLPVDLLGRKDPARMAAQQPQEAQGSNKSPDSGKKSSKGESFLKGTFILTIAGFVVKVIGSLNWIFVSRILGGEGIGLYQMAFPASRKLQKYQYTAIMVLNIEIISLLGESIQ